MTSPAQQTCPSCSTTAEDGAVVCAKCGTLLTDTIDSPEAADLLGSLGRALDGRYIVGQPLGTGRGGITVRAHHAGSKRDVAIKVAWKDPAARTQVLRETILTAKVSHPAALAVRDIEAPDPMLVVEMPLASGGTLADPIANGKPMPYPRVLEIVRAAAGALDQAHAAGIIHGGLRPVKILIDEQGNPLVSDFEIRLPRRADWDVTRASEVGAQAYMPLEQRHDSPSIDGRVDQYALAIIAYELLRGQATWRINDEGVLEIDAIDIMVHRPVAPDAPLSASMAIKRATAKDPAFRYASAGAFARAFSGEAVDVHAGAQIHRDAVITRQRRSKAWLAIPAVLAIAVVAVQPNARESVAELWKGSWPFGDGLKISSSNPILPAQSGNTVIGRTNDPAKPPGQPTNTRVGDTSRTVAAGQPARPADASPREQQAPGRQANGSSQNGNTTRPGTSTPAATIASGSSRDTTPRRAAVGGEITPRNNTSATAPSTAAAKGDGVVVITVDANERAAVFIDGRPRGQTPLTLKISSGKHTVAVRSGTTSFLPSSLSIDVAPGDTTRATFGLGRP